MGNSTWWPNGLANTLHLQYGLQPLAVHLLNILYVSYFITLSHHLMNWFRNQRAYSNPYLWSSFSPLLWNLTRDLTMTMAIPKVPFQVLTILHAKDPFGVNVVIKYCCKLLLLPTLVIVTTFSEFLRMFFSPNTQWKYFSFLVKLSQYMTKYYNTWVLWLDMWDCHLDQLLIWLRF